MFYQRKLNQEYLHLQTHMRDIYILHHRHNNWNYFRCSSTCYSRSRWANKGYIWDIYSMYFLIYTSKKWWWWHIGKTFNSLLGKNESCFQNVYPNYFLGHLLEKFSFKITFTNLKEKWVYLHVLNSWGRRSLVQWTSDGKKRRTF